MLSFGYVIANFIKIKIISFSNLRVRSFPKKLLKTRKILCHQKRAYPFSSCKNNTRAVITVEAALLLPLFMAAVLSMLFIIETYRTKSDIEHILYETGKEFVRYGYIYDKTNENEQKGRELLKKMAGLIGSNLVVKNRVIKELDTVQSGYIENLTVVQGDFIDEEGMLHIAVKYTIRLPLPLFGIKRIPVTQKVSMHNWIGFTDDRQEELVYITPSGSVFHRRMTCTYLKLSVVKVPFNTIHTKRNASGSIYKPCELCGHNNQGIMVYITSYGERYHTNEACSGLKRGILTVHISKVGSKKPCSKCGG